MPINYPNKGSTDSVLLKDKKQKAKFLGFGDRGVVIAIDAVDNIYNCITQGKKKLALFGPSGYGKSFFAKEIAYRLLEQKKSPYRVFVNISFGTNESSTLDFLVNKLLFAFGYEQIAGLTQEKKVAICIELLSDVPTYIVLDNFENANISDIAPFIIFIPTSCIVVITAITDTSIASLSFHPIRIKELNEANTRKLALYFSSKYDSSPFTKDDTGVLSNIYQYSKGSPKMIGLVVGLMKYSSLAEIMSQLSQLNARNVIDGEHVVIDGLSSLHEHVWKTLGENSKQILTIAVLFRSVFSEAVMRFVSGLSEADLDKALKELVDACLLEIQRYGDSHFYSMHRSTYFFMLSHIKKEAKSLDVYCKKLVRFYIDVIQKNPENVREFENDISTILHCADICKTIDPQLFIVLVNTIYDILFFVGRSHDRISLAEHATNVALGNDDFSFASHFVTIYASSYTMQGSYCKAKTALSKGMDYARKSGDELRILYTMRCIALNLYRSGEVKKAQATMAGLLEKTKIEANRESDVVRKKEFYHAYIDMQSLYGNILFWQGDYNEAKKIFENMLSLCDEYKWNRAKSYPYRMLAEIAMLETDDGLGRAKEFLDKALSIAIKHNDYRQIGKINLSFFKLWLYRAKYIKAYKSYKIANEIFSNLVSNNEIAELNAIFGRRNLLIRFFRLTMFFLKRKKGYYGSIPIDGE